MRRSAALPWVLMAAAAAACSAAGGGAGGGASSGNTKAAGGADSGSGSGATSNVVLPSAGASDGPAISVGSMRIEPQDATLDISATTPATQAYRVFASINGASEEEITSRTVFYVPDNYQIGDFTDNGPLFSTNAVQPTGGKLTVAALAANSDGSTVEVTTSLTVRLSATLSDPREFPADLAGLYTLPDDPASLFGGSADPTYAPRIIYPNDGTLIPPNLQNLELHFVPGSAVPVGTDQGVFELSFASPMLTLKYYLKCGLQVGQTLQGCVFKLDDEGFRMLAQSNIGGDAITIRVRGADNAGTKVGESAPVQLFVARTPLLGALYYWRTNQITADNQDSVAPGSIMRIDFGTLDSESEEFVDGNDPRLASGEDKSISNNRCVGCHALSRDGTKLVASMGGMGPAAPKGVSMGYLVFVNDLSKPKTADDFFTKAGDNDPDTNIQFASFNPDGTRFAAVYGDTSVVSLNNTLWFHDGTTGDRLPNESVNLPWEPDHPDWSPDGNMIALTRVGVHQRSQQPFECGVELLRKSGNSWSAPETLVPIVAGTSSYDPNFSPDSSLLVYSQSVCPPGTTASSECDADSDPTATTYAIMPQQGAAPVHLSQASAPGEADSDSNLTDTFARFAPFKSEFHDTTVYWVTISSKRAIGVRNELRQFQQLWMFAIDPAKVLAGEDGSYPAFHLTFQDANSTASNHVAQWTEKIVSDQPRQPPTPEAPPVPEPPIPR